MPSVTPRAGALHGLKDRLATIDWRRIRLASIVAALTIGCDLAGFWWTHSTPQGRVVGGLIAAGCGGGAYYGVFLTDRIQDYIARSSIARSSSVLVADIYSALRNLEYGDREIRDALYELRARDLRDFDTGFRAAMAKLRAPQRLT